MDWAQDENFHGIVRLYRDLIRLRLNRDARTAGLTGGGINVFHNNDAANLLAFHRWRDHGVGDDVVVVANLSASERGGYRIGFPSAGEWTCVFNSDARIYSDAFGDFLSTDVTAAAPSYDGLPASAEIAIAPYTLLVFARA